MNTISRTLALLKPVDLFPAWKWIDMMEECGEIETDEAHRWKEGLYGLMVLWELEPDEVLGSLDWLYQNGLRQVVQLPVYRVIHQEYDP